MNDLSQSLDGRPKPDEIGPRQGFQSALAALIGVAKVLATRSSELPLR